jgi:hypothetical protein
MKGCRAVAMNPYRQAPDLGDLDPQLAEVVDRAIAILDEAITTRSPGRDVLISMPDHVVLSHVQRAVGVP